MPLVTRVYVQPPIDEYTEYAELVVEANRDEVQTIHWNYADNTVEVLQTSLSYKATISNKEVKDETVINSRGYEIQTMGQFILTLSEVVENPRLSDMTLVLVVDEEEEEERE